ncbi:hypothetical protein N7532_004353 [Penicillium argentinense]|uniref:Cytochrome b5 heme-binding domain-containing protein n=1 Tax=Penicillium argentinense TaxID=1131581 RepID=A0A9W9FP82_9EURO|nr:uncharacterized protein N7532_004353 [Penicillium argentinense]KAJ5103824.1 hypothetical protein N7532_004353 [Penicillium argentinense]
MYWNSLCTLDMRLHDVYFVLCVLGDLDRSARTTGCLGESADAICNRRNAAAPPPLSVHAFAPSPSSPTWAGKGMASLFASAGSLISRYTGRNFATQTPSTPLDSRSEANASADQPAASLDAETPNPPSIETEEDSPQTTPKASASNAPLPILSVPTLNLDGDTSNKDTTSVAASSTENSHGSSKQTPSAKLDNGPSEAMSQKPLMAPTLVPQPKQQPTPSTTSSNTNASSLMPPPSVPRLRPTGTQSTNQLQPPQPSASSSLRPPPSAAAGLRVPPTSSGGSRLSSSTLAPVPVKKSTSRKVVLEPGYSPLDWAARTADPKNQLRGANMPPGYLRVTPSMLKAQNGRKGRDAWTSYQGKVYNIQPYVPYHPGGKGELLRGAGKDSAQLFQEIHPWVNWDGILGECLVGILVSENDAQAENALDAMD